MSNLIEMADTLPMNPLNALEEQHQDFQIDPVLVVLFAVLTELLVLGHAGHSSFFHGNPSTPCFNETHFELRSIVMQEWVQTSYFQ